MDSGNTPSGTQTVVQQQNSAPWGGQQPYLQAGFSSALDNILNRPQQYYPNSTVVPFSPDTQTGLNMSRNLATGPNAAQSAQTALQNQLNPNMLDAASNPYLSGMMDMAMNKVRPTVDSAYNAAGRFGSGSAAQAMADAGMNALTNIGFQNYNNQLTNQQRAAALAPTVDQGTYLGANNMLAIGNQQEQQAAKQLQDQISRFNFAQQEPINRTQQFLGSVQGNYGQTGTSTSQQPLYNNTAANLLGLGLGGAQLGTMLFGNNSGQGLLSGLFK